MILTCQSGYGNWTDEGWNLRFRGNVYKQPNISEEKLNDLANVFLVGTDIEDLEPAAQTQARNLTAEIFIVQEPNANVSFNLVPVPAGNSGSATGSTASMAPVQQIQLGENTTLLGDFDKFRVLVGSTGPGGYLIAGNETQSLQRLDVYTDGTLTGNATAMLVPPTGLTVISDIDDILRVTRIYDPADGLRNTFARPFTPWMNMPDIYASWDRDFANTHFHYLTTTPEQATRNYMEFIFSTYPSGTFDTRPLNFSDVDATLSIRKYLLTRIFETFPERKFVLVADTSNADVMKAYPGMATEFPNQVQCIFLRNTSSTDSGDHFPYDTSGFENLNQNKYMFFNVPDDLTGLDIPGGQCYNQSVAQNVTFNTQGLPLGLSKDKAKKSIASRSIPASLPSWAALLSACVGLWLMHGI